MRVLRLMLVSACLASLISCGGGSGGSGGTPSANYTGGTLRMETGDSGGATIISSDAAYALKVTDSGGSPMGGLTVSYTEDSGSSVIFVSDPDGFYGDVIMIGAPEELAARSARAGLYNIGVVMLPKNAEPIGFGSDARNLGSVYFSDTSKESMISESGCYTPNEMVNYFRSRYQTSYSGGWSVLMFDGAEDSTAANLMYGSYYQQNEDYRMYGSLKTRLEHLYGASQGELDGEEFHLSCWYPPAGVGFDTMCEVERGDDICVTEPANSAPYMGGTPHTTVTAENAYVFYPAAYDSDADTLTFSIVNKPSWASFDTATGALTGTPLQSDAGTYAGIVISVSDGRETVSLPAFSVTVSINNSAPVVMGTPYTTVTADNAYSFYPSAYDADGDTLTWSISNKPTWAVFSTSTGALTGTPTEAQAGTYDDIIISVSDGEDTDSLDAFSITVAQYNSAPVVMGTPYTTVTADNAYSFYPSAYDADGDTLTWSISNKPTWAVFSTSTGALTGTPTEAQAGTYDDIIISVSDGEDTDSLDAFSITVAQYNSAPVVMGTPYATVTADNAYSFYPSAYDADGDTLTWSIQNKPDWAGFSTSTGALTGTPAESDAGTHSDIILSVSDGEETVSLDSFDIVVSIGNSAPYIGGSPVTEVMKGMTYSYTPGYYDADGDSLIYSVRVTKDSVEQSWLSIDADTGELTGDPVTAGAGAYDVTVSVSDDYETSTMSYTITVPPVLYHNGLIWQDEAGMIAIPRNWEGAKSYCEGLTLGGYSGWDMPTIYELREIVDTDNYPTIIAGFENVNDYNYWSSTDTDNPVPFVYGWGIYFSDGSEFDYIFRAEESFIRCVR